MEILVFILMMLVVLNCAMKTSLWTLGPRLAFALLLGAFAYWSIDYAVMQSKTQIDNWLHREDVLQGIAIIVTLESAIGLMYFFHVLTMMERDHGDVSFDSCSMLTRACCFSLWYSMGSPNFYSSMWVWIFPPPA